MNSYRENADSDLKSDTAMKKVQNELKSIAHDQSFFDIIKNLDLNYALLRKDLNKIRSVSNSFKEKGGNSIGRNNNKEFQFQVNNNVNKGIDDKMIIDDVPKYDDNIKPSSKSSPLFLQNFTNEIYSKNKETPGVPMSNNEAQNIIQPIIHSNHINNSISKPTAIINLDCDIDSNLKGVIDQIGNNY